MKQNLIQIIPCSILFIMGTVLCSSQSRANEIVEGDFYQITVKTVKEANTQEVQLTVMPKGNVHCNLEYPWHIKVKDADGIAFSALEYRKADTVRYTSEMVTFVLPVVKVMKGKSSAATLEVRFSMCDDKQCYMKKILIKYP